MDAWETWLVQKLPLLASLFGFTADSDEVAFIATEGLAAAGFDDVADVGGDDEPLLKAALLVEAWEWIATAVAGDYDFAADGGRYSRSQLHKHATERLAKAASDAAAAGVPKYASPPVELGYVEMS